MKVLFLAFWLVILLGCSSKTKDNKETVTKSDLTSTWVNRYSGLDEPSLTEILQMRSYLMLMYSSSHGSIWNILSIRQKDDRFVGFHKQVAYTQLHSIEEALYDTVSFKYSTVRFNLDSIQLRQSRRILSDAQIWTLPDSVVTVHLDGQLLELIMFDGRRLKHIYRSFAAEDELEDYLIDRVNELKTITPNEPLPFYMRVNSKK